MGREKLQEIANKQSVSVSVTNTPDDVCPPGPNTGHLMTTHQFGPEISTPLVPRQPVPEGTVRFRTSLPLKTREDSLRVYKAQITQDVSIRDVIEKTLEVTDWVTHDWTGVREDTGEVTSGIRTVLFCSDGRTVAAVSDGVAACLSALIGWAGPAPWSPPLSLKCVEHPSSRDPKRRYYLLEPV